MSTKIIDLDGPRIGLKSSDDLYDKLKFDDSRLAKEWAPYDIFNFIITSWHLFHDWTRSDPPKALSRSKRNRHKLPDEMNLVLDVVRDLANGSKHFYLEDKSAKNRKITQTHTGEEYGYFEWFFHEDLPAVTVDSHWYFSIRVLRNLVMAYFEWVFDDSKPVKEFPSEILESIRYCNIATRRGRAPRIWSIGL